MLRLLKYFFLILMAFMVGWAFFDLHFIAAFCFAASGGLLLTYLFDQLIYCGFPGHRFKYLTDDNSSPDRIQFHLTRMKNLRTEYNEALIIAFSAVTIGVFLTQKLIPQDISPFLVKVFYIGYALVALVMGLFIARGLKVLMKRQYVAFVTLVRGSDHPSCRMLKEQRARPSNLIRRLRGHLLPVTGAVFSSDRRFMLSVSGVAPERAEESREFDQSLRLWDMESDREIPRFEGAKDWITSIALTPDGRSVLTAHGLRGKRAIPAWDAETICVWNLRTGRITRRFAGFTDPVSCMAAGHRAQSIVTGGYDGSLRIWDLKTGEEKLRLDGHSDIIWSVGFTMDGRNVLSASGGRVVRGRMFEGEDATIRLWDANTGHELARMTGHKGAVTCLDISKAGARAVSGGLDGTVRIWNTLTHEEIQCLRGHRDEVFSVAYSPDGRRILSAGGGPSKNNDNSVRLWDAATGKEIASFKGHKGMVRCVRFSPDGRSALSAGSGKEYVDGHWFDDHSIRFWGLPH